MEIVTKKQIDELDGLIKKYSNPEVFEETVAGVTMRMCKNADTSPLTERRKRLIAQEQCENIVTAALNLSKIMPKADFVSFLHENKGIFYFDLAYFVRPYALDLETSHACCVDDVIKGIRNATHFDRFWIISNIDMEKVIKTYTELTNFYKYVKKYPLTKDDVLNNIYAEQNC